MKRVLLLVLSLILILQSGFIGIAFANTDEISLIAEKSVVSSNPIPESIKILCIGNSFSQDSTEWLYSVLADLGVKEIILGNLYIGGCTLKTHAKNAESGEEAYTYYKGDADSQGVMTAVKGKKSLIYALADEEWDYISMQQGSPVSGVPSAYEPYLANLIAYVNENKTNPDAKLMWHMTWAYQGDSSHANFPTYACDQNVMYKSIVRATKLLMDSHDEISVLIPVGTAVQNIRTSTIGDTLTRDGHHLTYVLGRYLASVVWAKSILGCDISNLKVLPEGMNSEDLPLVIESVNNAYANPLEVTFSDFTTPEIIGYRESQKDFEIVECDLPGTFDEETQTFTFENGVAVKHGSKHLYLPDVSIDSEVSACGYVDGVLFAPKKFISIMKSETPYEKFSGEIASCTLETKVQDGKMLGTIIIENHLKDESLDGVVRFRDDAIADKVGEVAIGTIRGGEVIKTVVELPLELEGTYEADLSYDYYAQYGEYGCDASRTFIFVKKPGEIKVDGIISEGEWDNTIKLTLDENSTVGMKNWTDNNDLSAVAYIAYDSKAIYLAAEVTDDIFKPHLHAAWLNGDSIQADFYLDEDTGHFTPGAYTKYTEIGSSLARSLPGVYRSATNTGKLAKGVINNAMVMINRVDDKIIYEIAVDWTDIFGVDFVPEKEKALGFTFLVNEKDTESNEGWLKFAEGAGGNGKRYPNEFAQMYFVDVDNEDASNDGSFVEDGIKYVLFRRTLSSKGATVEWNADTNTATATKGDVVVSATVGATEIISGGVSVRFCGAVKKINHRTYIREDTANKLFDN